MEPVVRLNMPTEITQFTQDDNLLLQSYITVSLLAELKNNNFLESEYYDSMNFGIPEFKEPLREIGVDNRGSAMMALYAMLVLPRELVQNAYAAQYDAINEFLNNHTQHTATNYRSDSSKTDFVRHIRNAVSHARVSFRSNDVIIFKDEHTRAGEAFSTELPLMYLGEFLNRLQIVHLAYIQKMHERSQT
jgi:HEPN pEK499 p136